MAHERDHEGFAEAVERKKQASKEASERTSGSPEGDTGIEGDQNDLPSPRTDGTQHKKVTADKWNQ